MKKVLFTCVLVCLLASVTGMAHEWDWGTFPAVPPGNDPGIGKVPFHNTGFDPDNDLVDLFMNTASTGDIGYMNAMLADHPELAFAASSKDGKTALHIAAMVGKCKAAKVLLAAGADPNARDFYCKTPYYYARVGYRHDVQRLLRRNGARWRNFTFFPHCCGVDHPNPRYRQGRKLCGVPRDPF